ncbi:hypothetical protein ACG9WR_14500 [Acinetobacter pittii]|uniref:hypothetical protein n=1 Tax=Acinetobacter calcoaceticus/baumannii complex TaxID=909768 RepID=UPI00044B77C5|nr:MULTISPECIES: hypothetical protein [Acinetobacter calcoaceticus/baumannii complex]EXR35448.1 hypothetical protein J655_4082 [Acinetobacter sp. 1294243]EXR41367.1 hypothetical protein J655_2489 [Acinetobacter sp. 1294243]OCY23102.1 hypothetical protein BFR62_06800 [Acinetobacter pittii]OCY29565.1 hypothetical protein BFR75_13735 [Acinetobacter pittii]OTU43002.1 hypothetical protein CAT37_11575 [Acinetobacter pittii]
MSNSYKFQLKLELDLKLITPEEIQDWAMHALEDDPTNELALDICFLSNTEQVLQYFRLTERSEFSETLIDKVTTKVLENYIFKHINTVNHKDQIYSFFQNIFSINLYLEKEELRFLIYSYEGQLEMALEDYSELETEELWENFKMELKRYFSSANNFHN